MKKRIIAIIIALVCGISTLYAQNVVKNETYVAINGVRMYLHKIRPGETIEAIAKAYNTTVQIISMNNQNLNGNFPEGVMLRIPVNDDDKTNGSTQKFAYHEVEKTQSLYGIARQYGVTEDDIIRYNPHTKSGIKAGEILKIPVDNVQNPDRPNLNFVYHTVKKNESVNSICSLYNVDINDFYKYNPKAKASCKEDDVVVLPKRDPNQGSDSKTAQSNLGNANIMKPPVNNTTNSYEYKFKIKQLDNREMVVHSSTYEWTNNACNKNTYEIEVPANTVTIIYAYRSVLSEVPVPGLRLLSGVTKCMGGVASFVNTNLEAGLNTISEGLHDLSIPSGTGDVDIYLFTKEEDIHAFRQASTSDCRKYYDPKYDLQNQKSGTKTINFTKPTGKSFYIYLGLLNKDMNDAITVRLEAVAITAEEVPVSTSSY